MSFFGKNFHKERNKEEKGPVSLCKLTVFKYRSYTNDHALVHKVNPNISWYQEFCSLVAMTDNFLLLVIVGERTMRKGYSCCGSSFPF